MIGAGIMTEQRLVQWISANPAILGLGALKFQRVLPSSRAGQVSLVLYDRAESSFYAAEIQFGPTDDRHLIRVVERWAAERKRHPRRRCFAVLVAEEIAPRYLNVLRLISRGVPLLAIEMHNAEARGTASLRFTPLVLR